MARRLLRQRHQAGLRLIEEANGRPAWPEPDYDGLPLTSGVPELPAGEVTPELLRAAMLRHGCLLVRGMVDPEHAASLVEAIDRAYAARAGERADPGYFEEFQPDPRFDLAFERAVLKGAAGLWGADSPLVLSEVLELFERAGLDELARGYLGEPPAISINKCLLRKVEPSVFDESIGEDGRKPSAWHQDGAFMGEVRALNVWLALTRCGDVAPGMDLVPRRLDGIVPTGTEGAVFDWSVSQTVAEQAAGDAGIARPLFDPGDALLFDELFLHATAAEPDMPSTRYAIESWFFGPSAFPAKYAPLAF